MPSHVPVNLLQHECRVETAVGDAHCCCMAQSDTTSDALELAGKMLIAMPGMSDPRFAKSVVLICMHDDTGAMGLIVNKPSEELEEEQLMAHIEIETHPGSPPRPVYFGGPVETNHGFVLHSDDSSNHASSLRVSAGIAMTSTMDILVEIGAGGGPRDHLVALGYSGWGPGQLEGEILQNGWLTVDADHALVFDTPDAEKWAGALSRLGGDPLTLSAAAGHA